MNVTVVGGGISGLSAAWELSSDPDLDITVLEASDRLGGKINSSPFAGTVVDEGADAFLRRVPDALRLCTEVGITDLISPASSTAMVWIDGSLRTLPAGLVLGVPVQFEELERSEILSPWGLARARHEIELEGEPLDRDCSIGELISRRYGSEVTSRLVGPLLGGINAGAIDEMSVEAVAPQLAEAARRSRSLTEALTPPGSESAGSATPGGATEPVFAAPRGGMGRLIGELVAKLEDRGVSLRTSTPVTSLEPGRPAVLTTPAHVTAPLLADLAAGAADILAGIEFASVVFTALAYRREDLPPAILELGASGFLVPRDAGLTITAASFLSTKWAHLDGDPVILRVSVGHSADHRPIELSDEELLERIAADLRTTAGIECAPVASRITRYRDAFPQYRVGHLDRIAALETELADRAPHLAVCGMAHRGVGIPACIREARRAARTLADRLSGAALS